MSEFGLTPQQKKELKLAIKDLAGLMEVISQKRQALNEAVDAVSKNFQISNRKIRKITKAYFNSNFKTEIREMQEFEQLYDELFSDQQDRSQPPS